MLKIKNLLLNLFKNFFSPKEIIWVFLLLFISFFSLIVFIYHGASYFMTDRIVYTGNITEGIVDSPKNTNPFLSTSQVEKDVSKLLFTSLIKNVQKDSYELALAEKIEVSNDGLIYKVTIRNNIFFSNGQPITLDDIIYSLENIGGEKNYQVEKGEGSVLTFKLEKKDTTNFLETFTAPIISKNEAFDSNFSLNLITSSFFKIKSLEKDIDGNLTKMILERHNNGEEKLPYLKTYTLVFFKTEEDAYVAFQRKEIDLTTGLRGSVITKIKDDTNIKFELAKLPNNFAIFINQNKNEILRDNNLRIAMSDIIDRQSLTNQVLGSFGVPQYNILGENKKVKTAEEVLKALTSPQQTGFIFENGVLYQSTKAKSSDTNEGNLLDKTPIKVTITTIDNPELTETAAFIQNSWKKIGIETSIVIIDRNELNTVVKDRDFENLLFGFSVKDSSDYYSFFSSKERTYPKLNISNYTSINADKILDTLVNERDETIKQDLLKKLSLEIEKDNPIILLYKPQFVFAHFQKIHIKLTDTVLNTEDRYLRIENWYTDTEKVLSIFKDLHLINYLDTYTN